MSIQGVAERRNGDVVLDCVNMALRYEHVRSKYVKKNTKKIQRK